MTGPSVRSKQRLRAATSSAREVSGSGAANTFTTSAFSAVMTRAQVDPSAHAPWASTTLTPLIAILLLLVPSLPKYSPDRSDRLLTRRAWFVVTGRSGHHGPDARGP